MEVSRSFRLPVHTSERRIVNIEKANGKHLRAQLSRHKLNDNIQDFGRQRS